MELPSIMKKNAVSIKFTAIAIIFILLNNYLSDRKNKVFEKSHLNTVEKITSHISKLEAGISHSDKRQWNIIGIQKWIKKVNPDLTNDECYRYATAIVNEAEIQKIVDISLITSIMQQESYYINSAKSEKNAIGLMGIIEETGRWICSELNMTYNDSGILEVPEINIKIGAWFLSYLMQKYDSKVELVLAHYNGGSLQKARYLNKQTHQHTKEFKFTEEELSAKADALRTSLLNSDVKIKDLNDNPEYTYLKEVLSGKKLATETEKYIPEVLDRQKKIQVFLSNASSLEDLD